MLGKVRANAMVIAYLAGFFKGAHLSRFRNRPCTMYVSN